MTRTDWTREEIERTPYWHRPNVRCAIQRVDIDQDGQRHPVGLYKFEAKIQVDGNNPWITADIAGKQRASRISWGLALEILNNQFAAPLFFDGTAEFEI